MPDADLAVIGAGFWGTQIALDAQAKGQSVILVDDGRERGASRAAAGMSVHGWFTGNGTITRMSPPWWDKAAVDTGFQWLRGLGATRPGEWFTSYQHARKRHRPDLVMVESNRTVLDRACLLPRVMGQVTSLEWGPRGWLLHSVGLKVRNVVVAAGAWTDVLLRKSRLPTVGVSPLRGRALLLLPDPSRPPLTVPESHLVRPYTHYTLRPWPGGLMRLGDSVERTLDGVQGLDELLAVARQMAPGAKVVDVLEGLRPVCPRFTVDAIAPNLVVATGGHRVGLAMSPAVAARALSLLE